MDYLLSIFGMWWWKCCVRQTAPKQQQTQHLETDVRQETIRETQIQTPNKRETEMLINCHMWTPSQQTQILLQVSLSCTLKTTKLWPIWSSRAEVQPWDTFQEPTELRLIGCLTEPTWNQTKIQIKYVDTKKPPCWHANQREFHAWWVEPSSSFVEYHEFLKQKAECHVKERARRYFRRRFGDGEAETYEFDDGDVVSHNLSSTRKNSPQDLSDSNNPEPVRAEQGNWKIWCRHAPRPIKDTLGSWRWRITKNAGFTAVEEKYGSSHKPIASGKPEAKIMQKRGASAKRTQTDHSGRERAWIQIHLKSHERLGNGIGTLWLVIDGQSCAFRTQLASGNRCEVWRHTWWGQRWSFVTCKSQHQNFELNQ